MAKVHYQYVENQEWFVPFKNGFFDNSSHRMELYREDNVEKEQGQYEQSRKEQYEQSRKQSIIIVKME